jgi:phosphoacetylglucosamine mutase
MHMERIRYRGIFQSSARHSKSSSYVLYTTSVITSHQLTQAGRAAPPPLVIDCANGVGAPAAEKLSGLVKENLLLVLENTSTTTPGALNNSCGADYVKTTQKLPSSLASKLNAGQRGCSLDGDADRLMYFYIDEGGKFHMLDGDKIAALVAAFIVELVKTAGLEGQLNIGVVQTAYANGASTKYLAEVRNLNMS